MKKIALAFSTALLFTSCSNDDNSSPEESILFGKWYYKEIVVNNITIPYDDHEECGKDYIEFYDQNKIRGIDVWNCEEEIDWGGTFTKTNNTLTLYNGSDSISAEIIELTSESLVYKYDRDENGDGRDEHYIQKFTRQ